MFAQLSMIMSCCAVKKSDGKRCTNTGRFDGKITEYGNMFCGIHIKSHQSADAADGKKVSSGKKKTKKQDKILSILDKNKHFVTYIIIWDEHINGWMFGGYFDVNEIKNGVFKYTYRKVEYTVYVDMLYQTNSKTKWNRSIGIVGGKWTDKEHCVFEIEDVFIPNHPISTSKMMCFYNLPYKRKKDFPDIQFLPQPLNEKKQILLAKDLYNDRIQILQETLSKEPDIQKCVQVVVYINKQWQVCNQMSYVLASLSVMYPELVYKSDMEYYEMAENCPIISQLPKDIISSNNDDGKVLNKYKNDNNNNDDNGDNDSKNDEKDDNLNWHEKTQICKVYTDGNKMPVPCLFTMTLQTQDGCYPMGLHIIESKHTLLYPTNYTTNNRGTIFSKNEPCYHHFDPLEYIPSFNASVQDDSPDKINIANNLNLNELSLSDIKENEELYSLAKERIIRVWDIIDDEWQIKEPIRRHLLEGCKSGEIIYKSGVHMATQEAIWGLIKNRYQCGRSSKFGLTNAKGDWLTDIYGKGLYLSPLGKPALDGIKLYGTEKNKWRFGLLLSVACTTDGKEVISPRTDKKDPILYELRSTSSNIGIDNIDNPERFIVTEKFIPYTVHYKYLVAFYN